MNPLWLWLIVPASAWLGALLMALIVGDNSGRINMERFDGTMRTFADHLRNSGEEKAAEAVETVLKAVNRGIFK